MERPRIDTMTFSCVYTLFVQKVEKKEEHKRSR